MTDETDPPEGKDDEDASGEGGTLPVSTLTFQWKGGDVVILDIVAFADRFKTYTVRSRYETGDLEILVEDGTQWKKLGRHLNSVGK